VRQVNTAVVVLLVVGISGCVKAPDRGSSEAAPASSPLPQTRGSRPDVCSLLTSSEIADVTGLAIDRIEKKPDGCAWYANPAAMQQKGADTVRSTFETLNKQEPKSESEGLQSMEGMLKGLTGAASPNRPLFAVTVQWDHADEAEMTLKGTVGAIGGGMPGGRFEPIEGLGDRAYAGPAGSFYYVRKGPALVTFGLGVGTRDQAVALARRVVSRLP